MMITIKFIYNPNKKFTKMHNAFLTWELKEINQNYLYNVLSIPLNKIQDFSSIRSSIIIFDNIAFSEYLSNIIKTVRYMQPLVDFIFISKIISSQEKTQLSDAGINHFVDDNTYSESLLKSIIKNILDKLFYIDCHNFVFLHVDQYRLDLINKKVWKNENLIPITRREFELFRYFILNKNKILNKEQILENVWGYVGILDTTNLVSQHIFRIRTKLNLDNLIYIKQEGYVYLNDS